MKAGWVLFMSLCVTLSGGTSLLASTGDLSSEIERFVVKQFPESEHHFWVVNNTEWQSDDEVVVDVNAIVVNRHQPDPIENRFLLLIVEGKLAAAQNIPLGSEVHCQPGKDV
jgi:hypothetical protein